ncbi:MAG: S41 family peptidase [Flavobacteriales bacterium]|nr:S41 family peptidase [Flavobacteriales bacterium]
MKIQKIFSVIAFLCFSSSQINAQNGDIQASMNKFGTLLTIISQTYVDTVNETKLVDHAIVNLLQDLDPHSVYISPQDKEKMNEPLIGNFEGVGIQFNIIKDTILVVSPIVGGPSEKLGIMSGDKIIIIDDDTVAGVGFTNDKVVKSLRGPKGTIVHVSMKRNGEPELLDFEIKRDKIPIYSVDEGYMVDDKTGYIRVNRFARNTVEEFRAELVTLKKEGLENLVLDLRGNGGGYLNTAIELADEFLDRDKLIVYTQGRNFPKDETKSTLNGNFKKGKLVVLIDESSASASEIVSGAIQDWDRGIIIGRRSFGKGLVQKPYPLPDGSEVRLTISRYYTPSGRCIQRPYGDGTDKYYEDLRARYEHGELMNEDSISFPDSLKFQTRINKRTVYGGGGIMPDVFVGVDTSARSDYYFKLLRKGTFNKYSLSYLDKKRKSLLKTYPDKYVFHKKFVVTEEQLNDFIAFGEKDKVPKNEADLEKSKAEIENLLKAYISRGLFNSGSYMMEINEVDKTFKMAISTINDDTFDRLKLRY